MISFHSKDIGKNDIAIISKTALLQENKREPAILKEVYFCEMIYLSQSVNKV